MVVEYTAGSVKCFNEAEAFTPRIRQAYRQAGEIIWSFNEAEAFTPRIPICECGKESFRIRASMRPRLLHLGSRRILGYGPIGFRRFNEAEAFTPRIPAYRNHGPVRAMGFNEAEAFTPRIRSEFSVTVRLGSGASMRPRLLHLGSPAAIRFEDCEV